MEIIIRPRRTGRTTKMMDWLNGDSNRILLTFSQQEADRLKEQYKEMPSVVDRIFSWDIWLRDQYGKSSRDTEVGIDNADYILQNYLKNPLRKITMEDE